MSLDEPRNWKHAQQLENPALLDGEPKARALVAEFIGERCLFLSPAACAQLAGHVVSDRSVFAAWFADLEASTGRTVLKQTRTSTLSDEDHILERLHHLKAEETYLNGCLAAMGSVYAPKLADEDERAAQEDTDRINAERAAEKADADAPRRLAG